MGRKSKRRTVVRSSKSGKFVERGEAASHPDTTETETVGPAPKRKR